MWEILGIEPTNDIKKIKAAYATLAQQYNPEEHPEEFKRIHDAYKAACDRAKGVYRPFPAFIIKNSQRNSSHDIAERSREEEFDFPDNTDVHKDQPAERFIPEKKTDREEFDFSGVDTAEDNIYEEDQLDYIRIKTLAKLRNILFSQRSAVKDTDIETLFYRLFSDPNFQKIVNDDIFRTRAASIIASQSFDSGLAKRIAEAFGSGSAVYLADMFTGRCRVVISQPDKRTQMKHSFRAAYSAFSGSTPVHIPKFAAFTLILLAVIMFMVMPVLMIDGGGNTYSEPPQTEKITGMTVPENFSMDAFSVQCRGTWEFTGEDDLHDGYLEILPDKGFILHLSEGTTVTGTIDRSERVFDGVLIYMMYLSTDNEYYNDMCAAAVLLPSGKERIDLIFPDDEKISAYRTDTPSEEV